MKEIPLSSKHTKGAVAIVDDEDYEYLSLHNWILLRLKGNSYAYHYVAGGKPAYMHREICKHQGIQVDGMLVDHIDGLGLNNWRSNLRPVTPAQNRMNVITHSKSGIKGVRFHHGKWCANIRCDGVVHNLGRYETSEEAAAAYRGASLRLFGEHSSYATAPIV